MANSVDVIPAGVRATGLGLATVAHGIVLDAWYPRIEFSLSDDESGTQTISDNLIDEVLGEFARRSVGPDVDRGVEIRAVQTISDSLSSPPTDTYDVYLRLHLLSRRMIRPHDANLGGMFELLNNVAWTSRGPCLPEKVDQLHWNVRAAGSTLEVRSVDKIPRMVDYVVPTGVRIADADRVRLGAHLAPGTTVMHEGFCNFNAGTLGRSMVEGRISAGVVVGADSDIGGGASIMGTLSGGGKETVSIGERCLLGANSGVGISLGADCVVEAGLYVTSGTRVLLDGGEVVKAASLSGQPNLLYLRNSITGAVEARSRKTAWGELNATLHGA